MRIAFTSCMFNRVCPDQPVWGWIADQAPDRLLLLGDSLYLDLHLDSTETPQEMTDDTFGRRLFTLYGELMAQPQFRALVKHMPANSIDALWDDHDFLWNDAHGAELGRVHGEKIRLSTAFLEAFRASLSQGFAPGSFPSRYEDPVFWQPTQPPLSTPTLAPAPDLRLHLSDGRTFRTRTWLIKESKRTLFGKAQRDRFTTAFDAAPSEVVHLWASGSTVAGYERYENDLAWLHTLASRHRTLVLSGDIHRNQLDAFHTPGFPLHQATSSGAGVKDAVVVGNARQNFGLVDIDPFTVTLQLFRKNVLEHRRVLDRRTWLPV
ncbi:MAG: hypothetical protein ABW067_19795 [Rhizobacter sp.]